MRVNAFWIGERLGPIQAACLRSFLRHGHQVTLHVYDAPVDVPEGVELFDANRLMHRSEVMRHQRTGSLAFASDIYSYRILEAGMGIYVDCDVYCVRPFPDCDYLFGRESHKSINVAVLGAPKDSELVRLLVSHANDPAFIPPWLPLRRRLGLRARKMIGLPRHPSTMRWGTIGPQLLTFAVGSLGLEEKAFPIDAFYALHFSQWRLLNEPGLSVADLHTQRSYALHLWNAALDDRSAPAGSPLREIIES